MTDDDARSEGYPEPSEPTPEWDPCAVCGDPGDWYEPAGIPLCKHDRMEWDSEHPGCGESLLAREAAE